ncbi:HNH endonuclease [Stenotrophomonas maltophilia]|uniref:HNH endonuclease n=1 Tax=Stenotrophomonas maltophilia TaxID=40324 RepID=UPI002449F9B6|nr:HNH endonuclease [Stenotrophomonas maltophilia]MDH0740975.1 HNH endonuclease [Stenotrophomonas maltophilia]MDH1328411.1 HNH endonuclease [Stenotrophomonas maltophilia]
MRDILLSVARASQRLIPAAGHGGRKDKEHADSREALLGQARLLRRCAFCGFKFGGVADECEVHHLDGDHSINAPDNLTLACVLCHMPHHLDLASRRWSDSPGTLIYLPELTQAELSSLLQAIAYAVAVGSAEMKPGEVVTVAEQSGQDIYPHVVYARLTARAAQVEGTKNGESQRRQLSSPVVMARILQSMSDADYADRGQLLAGVRYLAPLDPIVELAKSWPVDGSGFKNLDLASWREIAAAAGVANGC